MRLKSIEPEIEYLPGKNIIVADKIYQQSEQGISTTAGCITECLQGHETPEGRVKKVDDAGNECFH